jgi:hypothetical protein
MGKCNGQFIEIGDIKCLVNAGVLYFFVRIKQF